MHLPRSVFSHRQLDLFLWLLKVNDIDDVPSVKTLQSLNASLQKMCGIESLPYDGALGHKYYVNSLSQIIAQVSNKINPLIKQRLTMKQEMANPRVRPYLSFYPENTGATLSEARQAEQWLHEAPDDQITPMARIGLQDFYIHEPTMLRDGRICIPFRWFTEGGVLFAKCWEMIPISTDTDQGWRVIQNKEFIVSQHNLLKTFPEFCDDAGPIYNLPHPSRIIGMCCYHRGPFLLILC